MLVYLRHLLALPSRAALGLIWVYQRTLSPDHGLMAVFFPYGVCPQHPTCSAYAMIHIRTDGLLRGGWRSLIRILGCHPWRKPDPERLAQL